MPLESPSKLNESVLTGTVMHKRKFDIDHGFSYPVWMVLSPLPGHANRETTLPALLRPRWPKYLSRGRIEELVGARLNPVETTIWLLTQPSLIGRSFNPVSFYFVTRGEDIHWIVAHITNTPWDEEHCYVLAQQQADSWTFDKEFHVSPFMPMALRYTWRFSVTADRIDIDMHLFKESQRVFVAALNLKPQPVSTWLGLKLRLTYPLQNLHTLVRIYYQAALLKLKGAHFYAHPNGTSIRRGEQL
jgi:DUF1365 family protein